VGNVVVVVADVGAVTVVAGVAGVAVVTENPCLTWRKRDTNTVFFRNEIRGGFDSRATGLIALSLSLSLSLSLTHTHTNTHTHTHTHELWWVQPASDGAELEREEGDPHRENRQHL